MKIKKIIAVIAIVSMLGCTMIPSMAQAYSYNDVDVAHWAYNEISAVTEAGLMHGKGAVEGTYFGKNDMLTASEMYATLYRLAGNPEVVPTFTNYIYIGYPKYVLHNNQWYTDPWTWAAYNGVSEVNWLLPAVPTPYIVATDLRYNSKFNGFEISTESVYAECYIDNDDIFKNVSRADVVLSLYYYATTYLGIEVTETADLSIFHDWSDTEAAPTSSKHTEGEFGSVVSTFSEELIAACEWAVGAGIIKGYDDGSLGLQKIIWEEGGSASVYVEKDRVPKYITRAEYAVILARFMDYIENIK